MLVHTIFRSSLAVVNALMFRLDVQHGHALEKLDSSLFLSNPFQKFINPIPSELCSTLPCGFVLFDETQSGLGQRLIHTALTAATETDPPTCAWR